MDVFVTGAWRGSVTSGEIGVGGLRPAGSPPGPVTLRYPSNASFTRNGGPE